MDVDDFGKWLDEGKISFSTYLNLTGEKTEHHFSPIVDSRLKISVLIATHNRKVYLIRLLNSIKDQNYNNYEIIIVDDASSDGTEETISQYKEDNPELNIIYLLNEQNSGASESRRRAYLKASGDIIIFADDDDYYIEPSYFSKLSRLYEDHPDCMMTIATAIRYIEREEKYEYLALNTPEALSNREYLNGFDGKYTRPRIFLVSLKKAELTRVHYEELLCFNDTSLQLFGLLGKGNVYTINQAVGIQCIHAGNISGNTTPGFIISNLESKEDIYQRAKKAGILDNPKEWQTRAMVGPASYHLIGNRKITREDRAVWKWMSDHLNRADYYRFAAGVLKSRIKRRWRICPLLSTRSGPH